MYGALQRRLCEELAARTGTRAEDWYLTVKARHAMLVALRALCETRGAGEVATQLLTCCTAVNPIVAAGLSPSYLDVDPSTVAISAKAVTALPSAAAGRLRAVVDQHTYGIVDGASSARLRDAAHAAGALVIEDCAHAVARLARDASGLPTADISVHSFGVEKMLPTYFGGAVWLNPAMPDADLRAELARRLSALPAPPARLERAMRSYGTQIRALNHLPDPASRALRRLLDRRGSFEPAIAPAELAGTVAHEPCRPGEWVAGQVLASLAGLEASWAMRREAAAAYAARLAPLADALALPATLLAMGTDPAAGTSWRAATASPEPAAAAQPLLRFPVFFEGERAANAALAEVNAAGYYAVPWYRPPLFPGVSDPVAYGLADALSAALPATARRTSGAVALPCDVTPAQAAALAAIVASHATSRPAPATPASR